MPAERCVDEAIDCFAQSQYIVWSQVEPAFEIIWWVNVQRVAPFIGGIWITTQESCLQVSTFQQMAFISDPMQNG